MEIDDDNELMTILSHQRRELSAVISTDTDLDFAFQLQMQEAINLSLLLSPSTSTTSSSSHHPSLLLPEVTTSPSALTHLLALEHLDHFQRERHDREIVNTENRAMQVNLKRLIHDQAFAREIQRVDEEEWRRVGDNIERPYGVGVGVEMEEEVFRVYCKGVVSEDGMFAAVGVAVCDWCDGCLVEVGKAVVVDGFEGGGGGGMDGVAVEIKAVVEALSVAVSIGLKRVHVFCDNNVVYQFLTGKGQATTNQFTTLGEQLTLLQRKFAYCGAFLVSQNRIRFAHKLARDALESEATKFAKSISGRTLLEQCAICFESIYSGQMFSVDKCLHRYCFSCMGKHVEAKLLQGKLPECPHEKCTSNLELESCKKFLSSELYDIMSLRVKEASIPPTDKVYCPYSNCSALMSKSEIQEYTPSSSSSAAGGTGMRKCVKCYRRFCINCKVPWHENYTCSYYLKFFPYQSANDVKLKSLATQNRWRQCIKCKNMVSLASGCYHISCRCGYEFCYTCGAEWIKKKPTCRCPIWDERNIIDRR